jgi:hypothetical protein
MEKKSLKRSSDKNAIFQKEIENGWTPLSKLG